MTVRFRKVLAGGSALALLAIAGCAHTANPDAAPSRVANTMHTASAVASPPVTTTPPTPTTTTPPPVDFTDAIKQAVADVPDGNISIAVFDRLNNKLVGSYNPDTPWFTESVVKLLIGLDSLDHGGSASTVAEMISRSDDNTASNLWGKLGGVKIVSTMAAKIGLHDTTPPKNPGEWGDTRTTANDLVLIYQYILDTAPASERDTIVTAMHNATNLGADGTDQYFGIPYGVGSATYWAVKQGWACCEPGWVLNTTGLVGPDQRYIVAVLTVHDTGGGSAVRKKDSNELTAAIKDLLPDLIS
ncbi:MAG TPA: serine hydrolase [Pseudonocardiaceae bacterium]|nr:serine hydrolase [Pseudonocardiaceae bacterium]